MTMEMVRHIAITRTANNKYTWPVLLKFFIFMLRLRMPILYSTNVRNTVVYIAARPMNRCSKPSAVYSTIDYSKLHETASAAYRCASIAASRC